MGKKFDCIVTLLGLRKKKRKKKSENHQIMTTFCNMNSNDAVLDVIHCSHIKSVLLLLLTL